MAGFSVGGGIEANPPGVSSGGVSGTQVGTGANAPSYGRTSTIAAPTLRDFVSLNDFAGTTNGNGATDDTTIVGNAVAALNVKGGGTLLIPPLNKNGVQALWTFQRVTMNGTANITVSAYGARAQFLSSSAGGSMFKGDGSATNPGSYNISQFKLFGLTVVGTGNENSLNQSVVQFDRSTDTTIRDTYVSLWNGAVYFLFDAARSRIEDNTLLECSHGGANPINISIEVSSLGWSTLLNDAYVVGNTVTACHTAPVAISCGSPSPTSTLTLGVVWGGGSAPTGGGTDVAFTQNQWTTANITNTSTAVTNIAPSQQTGMVFNVTGTGIPAATTLTITAGTTGTLSNAATATTTGVTLTLTASYATTATAIPFNATAAQVQTAIQAAITTAGGPTAAVTCYGGPLGQCWSGNTPPNPPVVIVFGTKLQGLLTNLSTTDAFTGGTSPASVFSYPRIMLKVQNNTLESDNLAALDIEFGGQASGGGTNGEFYHDGIVTGNFLTYTGANSGSAAGLVLSADSTPTIARGDLYRRWLVADNNIYSNHDGALLNGYDITFNDNTVRAGQYGVKVQPGAGGTCSNVHLKGGVIRMIDAGIAGAAAVLFNAVTDGTIDVPVYYDAGTTGTSDGITLTGCTRVDVRAKIANAPRHGLHITSCGDCHVEPGTRITNPSSNSSTATGITIDGTLTDNIHIDGVDIRDNRGIPTMKYGIDTSGATLNGFGVYERNGRIVGWVTSALHGTFALGGLNDLWDTTGVVWTAGKRVTWVTNAAPTTGTWGVGDIAWNLAPTAGGTSFWMCTAAGTPGTWTAQAFTGTGGASQNAVIAKGANYTMLVTDSTVKTTASAITITLPTAGLGASVGMLTWQVKNASTGNITVSSGTAGIIDNFTGGNLATTRTVIAGDAAVFQLDTNFTDWLLV